MHNFTQSGCLILFNPEHLSRQHKLGKSRQTLSLAEQLRSVQTPHGLLFNSSSSSSMDTMREPIQFMDPLHLFLLDQGIPAEYELDKLNTPHTGTTLFQPQNWLSTAMSNSAPAPSNYFTSEQHFLETFTLHPETTRNTN